MVESVRVWLLLGAALLVGAGLRLAYPGDMEFKSDERYTFEKTQTVGRSEPWPWTGMSNSADVPHPGGSVWFFVALARVTAAESPEELNLACMAVNVLALVTLAAFIATSVPPTDREPWWWGLGLLCVNPMAVLFHRKIWPPSVMPIFAVALIATWWYRRRPLAAFAFGLIGLLAAQVHPGTFFFLVAIVGWTWLWDRGSLCWWAGAVGAAIGSVPAWPWVHHLLFVADRSAAGAARWWHPFELRYWNLALTEPAGLGLQFALGDDFRDFLAGPVVAGCPTFGVAGLHLILVALLACCIVRAWRAGWARWGIDRTDTGLLTGAVMVAYGLLLTLGGLPVYRHYLIIAAPLLLVALARMLLLTGSQRSGRTLLAGLGVTQVVVSVLFLSYIHHHDQPIRGDYGTALRVQRSIGLAQR